MVKGGFLSLVLIGASSSSNSVLHFFIAGDFITRLYSSLENCEVDPLKCPASELSNNQKHLMEACEEVVQKIIQTYG